MRWLRKCTHARLQGPRVWQKHRLNHELVQTDRSTRDDRLHTRNRHLRKRRGFSVAFSNGLSVTVCNTCSFVSGMFQRIVTFPVDDHWNCPMDTRRNFATELYVCEFLVCNMLPQSMANLRTKIMDSRGPDSSRISIPRGPMSIGSFLESLSQAILVGMLLVGRLGVRRRAVARSAPESGAPAASEARLRQEYE